MYGEGRTVRVSERHGAVGTPCPLGPSVRPRRGPTQPCIPHQPPGIPQRCSCHCGHASFPCFPFIVFRRRNDRSDELPSTRHTAL